MEWEGKNINLDKIFHKRRESLKNENTSLFLNFKNRIQQVKTLENDVEKTIYGH